MLLTNPQAISKNSSLLMAARLPKLTYNTEFGACVSSQLMQLGSGAIIQLAGEYLCSGPIGNTGITLDREVALFAKKWERVINKKSQQPTGSESHPREFSLVFYCSSALNPCFPISCSNYFAVQPKKSRSTSVNFTVKFAFPSSQLISPSPVLHCAVNLAIFMKEKSGKSDLLVYGQQFLESKDAARPQLFMLAFFAAVRIRVSSKLPQQSYSYRPQKFLCTHDDVNLLSLLLFLVSEMEYINFISSAIILGEWNGVT
ncbi:hypothetical protein Cgig2_032677 [Carnegiea gigantea]|uniref:Uncharacterized protein n=1 Tax=Carnegiea gigantea TaxID=171969 RepID=A0A9Q1KJ98_9CARY|nr:hypothetical protein Cgig2_032677 [Carnegiea gigantea]